MNGDGKLDLLVGDSVTLIAPAEGLSAEEFKKKFAEWQSAVAAASKELSSATADQSKRQKASEEFNKVYQQRTEFMKEDRTGFVWLYLQK
jgi:TPP-dependent pyruvate/acetoin dehydrogenase alpha subunit